MRREEDSANRNVSLETLESIITFLAMFNLGCPPRKIWYKVDLIKIRGPRQVGDRCGTPASLIFLVDSI